MRECTTGRKLIPSSSPYWLLHEDDGSVCKHPYVPLHQGDDGSLTPSEQERVEEIRRGTDTGWYSQDDVEWLISMIDRLVLTRDTHD